MKQCGRHTTSLYNQRVYVTVGMFASNLYILSSEGDEYELSLDKERMLICVLDNWSSTVLSILVVLDNSHRMMGGASNRCNTVLSFGNALIITTKCQHFYTCVISI